MAQTDLDGFRAAWAVLGAGGVHENQGVTDFRYDEATLHRAMVERAENVMVLADSSKMGKIAEAVVCGLERVTVLVTEVEPPPLVVESLTRAGGRVLLPPKESSSQEDYKI